MGIITKTAQAILPLVALITCFCKTQLIIVYSLNMYQIGVYFSNKQSIYLSILLRTVTEGHGHQYNNMR